VCINWYDYRHSRLSSWSNSWRVITAAVGIIGAAIFVGYKVIKHLSPSKKRENRNKKRKTMKARRKAKRRKFANKKLDTQKELLITT